MQVAGVTQNRIDQPWMIENRIARFDIAQQIDQGNVVSLRARERAHDEIEIRGRKPRPTIRLDHRELIMSNGHATGKPVP